MSCSGTDDQRAEFEQQNLRNAVVMVIEEDGRIVGFGAARMAFWQIEPLLLTREFKKHGSKHAQRKGTYLLIRELDAGSATGRGISAAFTATSARSKGGRMQKLALSFGMLHIYRRLQILRERYLNGRRRADQFGQASTAAAQQTAANNQDMAISAQNDRAAAAHDEYAVRERRARFDRHAYRDDEPGQPDTVEPESGPIPAQFNQGKDQLAQSTASKKARWRSPSPIRERAAFNPQRLPGRPDAATGKRAGGRTRLALLRPDGPAEHCRAQQFLECQQYRIRKCGDGSKHVHSSGRELGQFQCGNLRDGGTADSEHT